MGGAASVDTHHLSQVLFAVFADIKLFHPQSNPVRQMLLLSPFYR